MMQHLFVDFEYRAEGRELILFCAWNTATGERTAIDMRQPGANAALAAFVAAHTQDTVWFAYAAEAELGALLVAGIDPSNMAWVCLMAESRQITGTHAAFRRPKASLLTTLQAFDIATPATTPHKLSMRELILSTSTYTDEQWAAIVAYCWSDIDPLPALWDAIQGVHAACDKPYPLSLAIYRGDYLIATSLLRHRSRGLPLDMPAFEAIFANLKPVRHHLIRQCNKHYGAELWHYVKRSDEYAFSFKALDDLLDRLPFEVDWEVTKSGRLKLQDDYLTEFCRRNPYFDRLHSTILILQQLKHCKWPALVSGGFLQGRSIPYYTVTGRNQPLVSGGFILNSPPWLRHLVRPEPGHVLIAADWSQQEIVLAAALSGDQQLIAALRTGDVYLAIAIMAGAAPANATKQSHPLERQSFKSAQLGIAYGMGRRKLGAKLFVDLREAGAEITLAECNERAAAILEWHKATFREYWQFTQREVNVARSQGWLATLDGWSYFADQNTSYTKLQNFPFQGNAAVILREAIKRLARYPEIEFMCSLHDAIYVYAPEDQATHHENILRRCMQEATAAVMQFAAVPLNIAVEVKQYDHANGYQDARGTALYHEIMQLVSAEISQSQAA